MSHMWVSSDELNELNRENERAQSKLQDQIDRLEKVIATKTASEVYRPGTFALRSDHERLDETVDSLFEIIRTQNHIIGELCLICDLDINDFPVIKSTKEKHR